MKLGKISIRVGWYSGEPIRIFHLQIGEIEEELVSFLDLQILKAAITITADRIN